MAMMFINRFLLCTALVSQASAISKTLVAQLEENKTENNPRQLRGGRNTGKDSVKALDGGIRKLENGARALSFGTEEDLDEAKHIIIACKEGESEFVCKKRIVSGASYARSELFVSQIILAASVFLFILLLLEVHGATSTVFQMCLFVCRFTQLFLRLYFSNRAPNFRKRICE